MPEVVEGLRVVTGQITVTGERVVHTAAVAGVVQVLMAGLGRLEQSALSGPEQTDNFHPHEQQTNKEQNGIRTS